MRRSSLERPTPDTESRSEFKRVQERIAFCGLSASAGAWVARWHFLLSSLFLLPYKDQELVISAGAGWKSPIRTIMRPTPIRNPLW
jgi:hypothetical protein